MKLKCSNSKFTTGRGYNYTKAYIEEEMSKYVCEIIVRVKHVGEDSEMFKI